MAAQKYAIYAHFPLVRIAPESIQLPGARFWKLPFDGYNQLSARAFEDHRRDYEATAPVFLNFEIEADLDAVERATGNAGGVIEAKARGSGSGWLEAFGLTQAAMLIEIYWSALLLAAPGALPPHPGLSQTFVVVEDGYQFRIRDQHADTLRVQGDADQEYLFLPEIPALTVDSDTVARLSKNSDLLGALVDDPELAAAFLALRDATHIVLSPPEQLTLSVMALEALLLPDVRDSLKATFARRVARLLGSGSADQERLTAAARELYARRSADLHGEKPAVDATGDPPTPSVAAALLGASIQTAARALMAGKAWVAQRDLLEPSPGPPEDAAASAVMVMPAALTDRLNRTRVSVAAHVSGDSLGAPDGQALIWCPLIGLGATEWVSLGAGAPVIAPLSGPEILSLEEKDIRRDFAAQLYVVDESVAGLVANADASRGTADERIALLCRQRNLAVAALRMAGFESFHDPELLGFSVFEGTLRYRRPTVLRQTLLTRLRTAPDAAVVAGDTRRIEPCWRLLAAYEARGPQPDIEHALTLFRRAFDRDFLPAHAQANIIMASLEAMLGRFSPAAGGPRVEDRVKVIAADTPESAAWFVKNGRRYRNGIAHGSIEPTDEAPEHAHLRAILRATLRAYLEAWAGSAANDRRPPAEILVAARR